MDGRDSSHCSADVGHPMPVTRATMEESVFRLKLFLRGEAAQGRVVGKPDRGYGRNLTFGDIFQQNRLNKVLLSVRYGLTRASRSSPVGKTGVPGIS